MTLNPLNPWIKIFLKISAVSLNFILLTLTSCKVLEKTNEMSLRHSKTDGQTDKGYYYGPHRVNTGSKFIGYLKTDEQTRGTTKDPMNRAGVQNFISEYED